MKRAWNFSKLNNREKKVYSLSDIKISERGLSVNFVIIAACSLGVSLILNCIICSVINYWYINPFLNGEVDFMPLMLVVGIPFGIALLLYHKKISNYRLYEFIYLYFKPRATIDPIGNKVTHTYIEYDAFLENPRVKED